MELTLSEQSGYYFIVSHTPYLKDDVLICGQCHLLNTLGQGHTCSCEPETSQVYFMKVLKDRTLAFYIPLQPVTYAHHAINKTKTTYIDRVNLQQQEEMQIESLTLWYHYH